MKFSIVIFLFSIQALAQVSTDALTNILWNETPRLVYGTKELKLDMSGLKPESGKAIAKLVSDGKLKTLPKDSKIIFNTKIKDESIFIIKRDITDEDGVSFFSVIGVSADNKPLFIKQFDGGKYTGCTAPVSKKDIIEMPCAGGEGGQDWSFKVVIDSQKKLLKITDQKSSDD